MSGETGCARRVIFTADDFGLNEHVNAAVVQAARDGVLSATSLMVGAPAVDQAVAMARELPGLGVGLHIVLIDGKSVLPPEQIPGLVDETGRFDNRMVRTSLRLAASNSMRRQLDAEVRAQFEAFSQTGLALDHVNAHKHFHLHPMIAASIVRVARQFGARCIRLPLETTSGRVHGASARLEQLATRQSARALRRRLRRAGLCHNDHIVGLRDTGQMTEQRLLQQITTLPSGVTEIYSHPATCNAGISSAKGYDHVGELQALTSARVQQALETRGLVPLRFADLPGT